MKMTAQEKRDFTTRVLEKYGTKCDGYFSTDDGEIPWAEWKSAEEAIEYAYSMYEIAFKKIGTKVFILKDFRE